MPERESFSNEPQEEIKPKNKRAGLKAALALGATLVGGGALYKATQPTEPSADDTHSKSAAELRMEYSEPEHHRAFLRTVIMTNPESISSAEQLKEILRRMEALDPTDRENYGVFMSLKNYPNENISALAMRKIDEASDAERQRIFRGTDK